MTDIAPGSVLLVAGHSLEDRAIHLAQLRRDGKAAVWSHAAICIDGVRIIEAAGAHGVRYNTIAAYDGVKTRVFPIVATEEQRQTAVAFAEKQVGRQYDFLDLPSIGLNLLVNCPIEIHGAQRYICSWLVGLCLIAAGYTLPRDPADISPGDLAVLLQAPLVPR